MALQQPSKRVQRNAARPSSSRVERKQRALPGAARPDPYDVPASPEKPQVRLRRPDDEAPGFSPLRKQRVPHATKIDARDREDESHGGPQASTANVQDTENGFRRSPRRKPPPRMMPSEQSVGSLNRQEPALLSSNETKSAESRESEGIFVDPDELEVPEKRDCNPHEMAEVSTTQTRKRGRPRKSESRSEPTKQPKTSEEPLTAPTSSRRRVSARIASRNEPAEASSRPKVHSIRPGSIIFPNQDQDASHGPEASSDSEADMPNAAVSEKTITNGMQKARQDSPVVAHSQSEPESEDQTTERGDAGPEAEGTIETERANRLLGHHKTLQGVARCAKALLDCNHDEEIDKQIKAMRRFCIRFIKELREHQQRPEDLELLSDPPEQLVTIADDIRMLCGEDPARSVDQNDITMSQSIYLCFIPVLVRVLLALVECYQAVDVNTAPPERSVTIRHLGTINRFIGLIIQLSVGAKKFVRPDTQLNAVRPINHKIIPPLKKIEMRFSQEIKNYQILSIERARNREEARRREAEERAEAEAQAERAKWEKVEDKWTALHEERWRADENIKPRAKQRHLRQPEVEPEEDHNGHSFERLQVFRPRVGPPPALVEAARAQPWPRVSYNALWTGLERWSGDVRVFENIFRLHCGRNKPLNAYNVTEIVVMAASMKQFCEQNYDVEEAEWQWVKRIPDWTRPHTVLEQLEGHFEQ